MDMNVTQRKGGYAGSLMSRDGISGTLLILFGILALWLNRSLAFGTPTAMGPGFCPRILSIAIIAAGLWILARGVAGRHRDIAWSDIAAAPWRGLVVVSASIIVFALILETAGLFVSGVVLLLGASFANRRIRWIESIVFSLVTSFAVGAIFIWGLKVTIPMWPNL
jgi:hypothetical protein